MASFAAMHLRDRALKSVFSLAIFALATAPWASHAAPVETGRAAAISIGAGGSDRVDGQRTGRVERLPESGTRRWLWTRSGARIDVAPLALVGGDVAIVVGAGSSGGASELVRLSGRDGSVRWTARLPVEVPVGPPISLADGTIVVPLRRGQLVGVSADGDVRFRAVLGGPDHASVGLVPLTGGGFAAANAEALIEFDAQGELVGSTSLGPSTALSPIVAARTDGSIVAVTVAGDLYVWRAGTMLRRIGSFSGTASGPAGDACPFGPVIDESSGGASSTSKHQPRALCVQRTAATVTAVDFKDGARHLVIGGKGSLGVHTGIALGAHGEIYGVGSAGSLLATDVDGVDLTVMDPTMPLAPSRSSSSFAPVPQLAPIVDGEGRAIYATSDGVVSARPGGEEKLLARCAGGTGILLAGVAVVGPGKVVVACGEGRVELVDDGPK